MIHFKCISELWVNDIDNHANNLQFAIQSTIVILKLLTIGTRIVPLHDLIFKRKIP